VATECSRNDGSKTQYYIVILDWLQDRSGVLELAPELQIRSPLTIASLSAFDKENLIEFLLDFLHYLYNYYIVCALLSYAYHVTYYVTSYDVML